MGMAAPVYYTAEMVRGLPDDGNRYETVHGELLVTPAPRMWHQVVVERLRHALGIYLARHPGWQLLAAPADISWTSDVLVQPDLFVVPIAEARSLDWARLRHLELVVEVHGPGRSIHEAPPVPRGGDSGLLDRGRRRTLRGDLDAGGGPAEGRARAARMGPRGGRGAARALPAGAVPAGVSNRTPRRSRIPGLAPGVSPLSLP